MVTGSVSRRYAKALFSLALESGRVETWTESLHSFRDAIRGAPDLRDVFANPVYSREQRRAIVQGLAGALALDAEVANLLGLMSDRRRLDQIEGVVATFEALADAHLGRIRAKVISAVPLEAAAVQALGDKLSRATSRQVLLERAIDPSLLGGAVAQVGNIVYDGSVRTQLEDMRMALKR